MRPHAQDSNGMLFCEDLVHEPVMDIDAARVASAQIAAQLLVWRRFFQRVDAHHVQQVADLRSKTRCLYISQLLMRSLRKQDLVRVSSS